MKRLWQSLFAAATLAGAARAQGELGWRTVEPGCLRIESWADPLVLGSTPPEVAARAPVPRSVPGLAAFEVDAVAEELGALLAVQPPPVAREQLDGSGEELLRYHGVPGGIVLGLAARGTSELAGARIEGSVESGLALRLADGRSVRCPELSPDALRTCLAFAGQRQDALVDLTRVHGAAPRLAPAYEGSSLAPLLVRMDCTPHRVLPGTRGWKSLIVDRAVRCEVRGEELVLSADLEVRFYDDGGGSGWARRVSTVDSPAADFVGPRSAFDLAHELAPLAEIAGWLGFLRFAEEMDPSGIEALRAGAALRR